MRTRYVRPARAGDWSPPAREGGRLEGLDDPLTECDRCGRLTRALGVHATLSEGGFPACRPREHRYHDRREVGRV